MKIRNILLASSHYHRLVSLLLAMAVTASSFISPTAQLPREVLDVVFIVDITQSMNARDYQVKGQSIDRLQAVKQAIQHSLKQLPCGSKVGIGIFAAKDALLLFNPIELCEHYSLLNQVVSRLSWRMAWAGDSNIRRGLYSAIGQIAQLEDKPNIVFLSDGEQTTSEQYSAPLEKRSGKVAGLIVGVGGKQPVRIPKYNDANRLTGYWKSNNVGNKKTVRPKTDEDMDYLSQMDETRLRHYASITKLKMIRLENPLQLSKTLMNDQYTTTKVQTSDIRWLLASTALLIMIYPYLISLIRHKRAH
jgi:mxaL protein